MKEQEQLLLQEEEEGNQEAARDRRLAAERQRAEERMTLRHKNTGKWASRQLRRGKQMDTEVRLNRRRLYQETSYFQNSLDRPYPNS